MLYFVNVSEMHMADNHDLLVLLAMRKQNGSGRFADIVVFSIMICWFYLQCVSKSSHSGMKCFAQIATYIYIY